MSGRCREGLITPTSVCYLAQQLILPQPSNQTCPYPNLFCLPTTLPLQLLGVFRPVLGGSNRVTLLHFPGRVLQGGGKGRSGGVIPVAHGKGGGSRSNLSCWWLSAPFSLPPTLPCCENGVGLLRSGGGSSACFVQQLYLGGGQGTKAARKMGFSPGGTEMCPE